MLRPLRCKQAMDSLTLISWPSAAVAPHMVLMIRRCLLSQCFLPTLIWSRTHLLHRSTTVRSSVWSHLLSSIHVAGGFYFRSRGPSSVLAHLAPSLIPPSHAVVDFLRLHNSLGEDGLALLVWPACSSECFQMLDLFQSGDHGPSAAQLWRRTVQQDCNYAFTSSNLSSCHRVLLRNRGKLWNGWWPRHWSWAPEEAAFQHLLQSLSTSNDGDLCCV